LINSIISTNNCSVLIISGRIESSTFHLTSTIHLMTIIELQLMTIKLLVRLFQWMIK